MEESSRRSRWLRMISLIANLVLALLTTGLVLENRDIRTQLSQISLRSQPQTVIQGDRVRDIRGLSMDGDSTGLTFSDPAKHYAVFVFSTTCPHCESNLENWKSISSGAGIVEGSILGVSIHDRDKTWPYVQEKGLPFPVILADSAFARGFKAFVVPLTVLVRGDGVVENAWTGVLTEEAIKEIKKTLNVQPVS